MGVGTVGFLGGAAAAVVLQSERGSLAALAAGALFAAGCVIGAAIVTLLDARTRRAARRGVVLLHPTSGPRGGSAWTSRPRRGQPPAPRSHPAGVRH
ncbi:MAG: hypothetical protein ACREN7_02180 [Candidatus Dormibacteria bacterium]